MQTRLARLIERCRILVCSRPLVEAQQKSVPLQYLILMCVQWRTTCEYLRVCTYGVVKCLHPINNSLVCVFAYTCTYACVLLL